MKKIGIVIVFPLYKGCPLSLTFIKLRPYTTLLKLNIKFNALWKLHFYKVSKFVTGVRRTSDGR